MIRNFLMSNKACLETINLARKSDAFITHMYNYPYSRSFYAGPTTSQWSHIRKLSLTNAEPVLWVAGPETKWPNLSKNDRCQWIKKNHHHHFIQHDWFDKCTKFHWNLTNFIFGTKLAQKWQVSMNQKKSSSPFYSAWMIW